MRASKGKARRSKALARVPWNAAVCRLSIPQLESPLAVSAPASPGSPNPTDRGPNDRLDSWKEIASHFRRDVTTVQRWEKREGMPVHRHVHDRIGSVYAFRSELDAWAAGRNVTRDDREESPGRSLGEPTAAPGPGRSRLRIGPVAGLAAAVAIALAAWFVAVRGRSTEDPIAGSRFLQLTDFGGDEQAAAVSRDGRFVAFLSDRDGRMDVWVGVVGSGQFYNLTRGASPELVNPSLRTLGFSPDGTLVTFWTRRSTASDPSDIGIWSVPVLGGAPRPYLEGVAEFDWSSDGSRLVYHTPGPGDPMFVRATDEPVGRPIFSARPGLHAHFPVWAPDHSFIYFVQGSLPDRMDVWRIRPTGGEPERITNHEARVSHPVFLDTRTLLYLASDPDGHGPWIHCIDVNRRQPRRVSSGVERYTSLAASAAGRRLVATLSSPRSTLWRVPFGPRVDLAAGRRLSLTTVGGFAPRLGPTYLLRIFERRGRQHLEGRT